MDTLASDHIKKRAEMKILEHITTLKSFVPFYTALVLSSQNSEATVWSQRLATAFKIYYETLPLLSEPSCTVQLLERCVYTVSAKPTDVVILVVGKEYAQYLPSYYARREYKWKLDPRVLQEGSMSILDIEKRTHL